MEIASPNFDWSQYVRRSGAKSIWKLDNIVLHIAKRLEVNEIYLFGSRAYNTGSLRSDIDLLVYSERQVDLGAATSIYKDFPPVDIFRTRDLTFAESVVNSSRITARETGQLVRELSAVMLWNSSAGLNKDFKVWEQATRVDVRFQMTLAELPLSFGTKIFIGHGGANDWCELRELLTKHGYVCDHFNDQSVAGHSTKERLESMLRDSCFALLVATAEDLDSENRKHMRENVVHEIGLFQGRLGFSRAIVLLEEGCDEFSNIAGLGRIHFKRGKISDTLGQVVAALKRGIS